MMSMMQQLGVRASGVTIIRGHGSRDKLVRVAEVDQATVDDAFGM